MQIIHEKITIKELEKMAAKMFGDLVKAVVVNISSDVERSLDLLDLPIADSKNRGRLREIVRVRAVRV